MKKGFALFSITTTLILLTSCSVSGITGDKNVVTENRTVDGNFNNVKVSQGINLLLTQSETVSIVTETDKNIQELLIIENENGTLKIYLEKSVNATKLNVRVSMPEIKAISASSAADVEADTPIQGDELTLNASSGADIKLTVNTKQLYCDASSGSGIKLQGTSDTSALEASSGADITAKDLISQNVNASSSSGSNISIHVTQLLVANASSGSDINFFGNPKDLQINTSSGGDIKNKSK